ncbi:hypothetical protein AK830_g3649 [Neonectria ditissima]|uniref:Zn(2)-C6 fungal-type domain-containing protein n=1 Tax=Neonectria ditissima TaxID=78410 RepID=A0A0N8H7X1_9HYPO|nr:hypothetical protein AK830_g3649 [Neonectria ditissima]
MSTPTVPSRPTACILCQRRKIKCDRNFPCSHCTKAKVTCTPSTPAPPRKRRRPNVELQARLARCEKLLKGFSDGNPGMPESPTSRNEARTRDADLKTPGTLVDDDGTVRFTESYLRATVSKELKEMQTLMAGDDSAGEKIDWDLSSTEPEYKERVLSGSRSGATTVEDLQPSPSQIIRLWRAYWDRVHPLTKVIHAPTVQSYVFEAISGSKSIPGNIQALLFAIYTTAAISLTEEECVDMLGMPANTAYHRFSAGLRMTLMRIEFLKNHDLITLQALGLYLISLPGRGHSHGSWVLNGVCVRIAQKMGLHRDGEILGLSPFETEMRRRVWWHIVMIDTKSALDSGLNPSLLPGPSDCKTPTNLNDADISPDATEYYKDRNGPTEMIVCLLLYKMGEFLLNTTGLQAMVFHREVDAIGPGSQPRDFPSGRFKELTQQIEDSLNDVMERYSSPTAGSIHKLAAEVRFSILDKIHGMLRPPHEQPEWGTEIKSPQDNLFKIAITAVDHSIRVCRSTENTGFLWFMRMHFPHMVFLYLVGQLCHRTSGTLADRAWEQIPVVYHYHQELMDVSQKSNVALATDVLRAWKVRQAAIPTSAEQFPKVAECIQRLQTVFSKDTGGCFLPNVPMNPGVLGLSTETFSMEGLLGPPLLLDDSGQNGGIVSDYDLMMAFSQTGLDPQGNPHEGLDFASSILW